MKNGYKVDILLSTYNGEKYLNEQINSIINQSFKNWVILVRDDGSTDSTKNILEHFAIILKEQFVLIDNSPEHIGSSRSFMTLLSFSKSQYVMFCDQDDIWKEEKIKKSLLEIITVENNSPKATPILIHSDLEVVNDSLDIINISFWHYQNINPKICSFNRLLVSNNVTACSAIINARLKIICVSMHKSIIMHDWWIALVASKFGQISYINEPLIQYRQHNSNQIGSKKYISENPFDFIKKLLLLFNRKKYDTYCDDIKKTQKQAEAFLLHFHDKLSNKDILMLNNYRRLKNINIFKRKFFLLRYKLYPNNWGKIIQFLLLV